MRQPPYPRRGEILAGLAAVALLVIMFLTHWYDHRSGWSAVPVLRWFVLVTGLLALALAITQVARRSPALPVTLSVCVTVFGILTFLLLLIRVLTTSASVEVGAGLGIVTAFAVALGGFWSMRDEQGWTPDAEHPIETIPLRS